MASKLLSEFENGQIVAYNDWTLTMLHCKEIESLFINWGFPQTL